MRFALQIPRNVFAAAMLACLLGVPASGLAQKDVDNPAVVELYTSQGCASCPPADKLLGELDQRADVIALSFHVDYWNYIGWADPFAQEAFTSRQQSYMRRMHGRFVYTPQMIVDGLYQVIGSRGEKVTAAIERARMRAKSVQPRIEWTGSGARVVIPAGESTGPATVWMAFYQDRQETKVPRGENAGETLVNYNVVREMRRLATWTGERMEITLDGEAMGVERFDGCAVLVQLGDTGPILGAADMPVGAGAN